jgi:hypothetical protein
MKTSSNISEKFKLLAFVAGLLLCVAYYRNQNEAGLGGGMNEAAFGRIEHRSGLRNLAVVKSYGKILQRQVSRMLSTKTIQDLCTDYDLSYRKDGNEKTYTSNQKKAYDRTYEFAVDYIHQGTNPLRAALDKSLDKDGNKD